MDVATIFASAGARVHSLSARGDNKGRAVTTVSLDVKNLDDLKQIISRISAVAGVSEVGRGGA